MSFNHNMRFLRAEHLRWGGGTSCFLSEEVDLRHTDENILLHLSGANRPVELYKWSRHVPLLRKQPRSNQKADKSLSPPPPRGFCSGVTSLPGETLEETLAADKQAHDNGKLRFLKRYQPLSHVIL